MEKRWWPLLLLCGFLFAMQSALAQEAVPDDLLHEALLSDCYDRKNVEFWVEGHQILDTARDGNRVEVYLSASVGGYGFMGGGFMMQCGWGGPCTVVLRELDGEWSIIERKDIEDYSEIPTIMPKEVGDRCLSSTDNEAIQRQIKAQVQAYLDAIGRTEPIIDFSDLDAPLSNMLTCAANQRNGVDGDYPLSDTTMECLEDGERYLYTRAWKPDADGVVNPTYTTAEHGTLTMDGTTGTETLTKARKSDGTVIEIITVRVDEYRLTITLEDAGGSVCYVFDFDGWSYHQPTVTHEGQCGISTVGIDRYSKELPGERISTIETESQVDFHGNERFALLRDQSRHTLVYSRLENGAWVEAWRNALLLPATSAPMYLIAYENDTPALKESVRFSCLRGDTLGIYAGEEHPDVAVSISKNDAGVWQVVDYSDSITGLYAYLFADHMLINAADLTAMQTAGIWFGTVDQDAASFDPQSIWLTRDELRSQCADAPNIEYFADAEPLYMALGLDERLPVYTGPDKNAPRPANGKAAVSFSDWVIALCKQDEWMMVLYETGEDHYRTGWVDTGSNSKLARVCELTMPAHFSQGQSAVTNQTTPLYDDPVNVSGKLMTLKANTEVTVLWAYDSLCYVEVLAQSSVWRGFVDAKSLNEE